MVQVLGIKKFSICSTFDSASGIYQSSRGYALQDLRLVLFEPKACRSRTIAVRLIPIPFIQIYPSASPAPKPPHPQRSFCPNHGICDSPLTQPEVSASHVVHSGQIQKTDAPRFSIILPSLAPAACQRVRRCNSAEMMGPA